MVVGALNRESQHFQVSSRRLLDFTRVSQSWKRFVSAQNSFSRLCDIIIFSHKRGYSLTPSDDICQSRAMRTPLSSFDIDYKVEHARKASSENLERSSSSLLSYASRHHHLRTPAPRHTADVGEASMQVLQSHTVLVVGQMSLTRNWVRALWPDACSCPSHLPKTKHVGCSPDRGHPLFWRRGARPPLSVPSTWKH